MTAAKAVFHFPAKESPDGCFLLLPSRQGLLSDIPTRAHASADHLCQP